MNEQPKLTVILNCDSFRRSPFPYRGGGKNSAFHLASVYSVRTPYEQLVYFLRNRMRMSHVYQPVMLMTLLRQGGKCSSTEIARSILAHDQSQVEYYEDVTKNMVGRILGRHGIVEKEGSSYSLIGYGDLDDEQVEHLIELCEAKLDEYKAKRGKRIWQHRKALAGYISGTLRYEILKHARFRCELCGVSADTRALAHPRLVWR